jgi:tartrate-resistant acid phosphatase type 5
MYTVWRSKLPALLLIVALFLIGFMFLAGSPPPLAPASPTPAAAIFTPGASLPATATLTLPSTPSATPTVASSITPTQSPSPTLEPAVVFAVIGDYGTGNRNEGQVADLVKSWQPDFIITTGDNNYPSGSAKTIDATIGQFYHAYISPYKGDFGDGADQNRFFPSLGNHDWHTDGASPYLKYFTLPGNERYYDFTWGPMHFFAVDADSNEPDGVGRSSRQAKWLQARLAESTEPWKVVYFHQPPYSSGLHGSTDWMRWPFKDWGVTAVLSGHDHDYERLIVDGLVYFVNGLGGGGIYPFENRLEGSKVRFNDDYGAMRVEATSNMIQFQFISQAGDVIDSYEIER